MKRIDARRAGTCGAGAVLVLLGLAAAGAERAGSWTQWGGSGQDFVAEDSHGLAAAWPESGPPQLWSRDLGDGYSAILYEDGRLYTMYRAGAQEAVLCLDAATGKTIWEHRYDAATKENHVHQFGDGPRSTPLIAGDRLYTIGVSGHMLSLKKKSGKVAWSKNLWDDLGGNVLEHGYSSSPIEYQDKVIVLVGAADQSIVAFDKKTGKTVWKTEGFSNSYSTPRILQVDGKDQLVTFMATELVGLDPATGRVEWTYKHENQWKQNVAMPVMADSRHLFLSSPDAGARGLMLRRNGDSTEVEELWSTRKIQFYHVSTVRQGDYVYGSTGTMAPAFLAAINIRTGEIAWRERGFAKANCVMADGRLIILDEEGNLALATATPEKLTVHSKVKLFEDTSWTVPTVVGRRLFVRDKSKIVALDLG
jgi:outer membrane protein assembly factor BamB